VSAVDQHAEAHRLKTELRYGARRIAAELGITRYAAKQLLARPLPQPVAEPVAEVADEQRPAAEPVGHPVAEVADQRPPVAAPAAEVAVGERPVVEGVFVAAAPVGHVTGVARLALPGTRGPWLRVVDVSGRPRLWRDLMRLARVGLRIPYVVDVAVRSFAGAYHQAVIHGDLVPGEPYEVRTTIRPRRAA
jgi:hypothetical protein